MKPTIVKSALASALLAGVGIGLRAAAWPLVRLEVPERVQAPATETVASALGGADSPAGLAIARDPFRIPRRPSPVAYDPLRAGEPPAPLPPRPLLALVGIVWDGGKNPTGLLEGLPGVEGPRVVRAGEAIGGLQVKRIERERVLVVGLDTVWVLTVREPWK